MRIIPIQSRGRDRRHKILQQAALLIARDGYDAVTSGAIAAAAGIPIGSFYRYFESKEAVLVELAELYTRHAAARLADMRFEGAIPAHEAADTIHMFLGHLLDSFADDPLSASLLRAETHPVFQRYGSGLRQLYLDRFRTLLQALRPGAALAMSLVAFETAVSLASVIQRLPTAERRAYIAETVILLSSYIGHP